MRRAASFGALGILWGLLACGDVGETQGQAMDARSEPTVAKTGDRGASNQAPVIQGVRLTPTDPSPGDLVVARVDASDPDGDPIEFVYQWLVDGRRQPAAADTLHLQSARKGSRVEVSVVARDGRDQSAAGRASVRVGNSPPVLQGVVIEPLGEITAYQDVIASPTASDPDGDDIEYEYLWTVNGDTADEVGPVLSSDLYRRGDEIGLVVVASDGQDSSDPIESDAMVVGNARPKITSLPGAIGPDGVFRYSVVVEDADGDRLFRYRLTESPAGMQLDIVHGELTWEPSESQAGTHDVAIEVDDRSGGVASQSFTIQLDFGASTPASAAN